MPGLDFFAPVAAFAFSTLITPGPNNMMVAASGVNFGFGRTRAHVTGICVGFSLMVFLVGVGLGRVFQESATLHTLMRYVGFAFLCWIAWRIASSDISDATNKTRPLSFIEAAMFQWVNPKAWAMAAGAVAAFMTVGGSVYLESVLIAGVFLLLSFPCVSLWALFGSGAGKFLQRNRLCLRVFNVTMAVVLIIAMLPVFFAE